MYVTEFNTTTNLLMFIWSKLLNNLFSVVDTYTASGTATKPLDTRWQNLTHCDHVVVHGSNVPSLKEMLNSSVISKSQYELALKPQPVSRNRYKQVK